MRAISMERMTGKMANDTTKESRVHRVLTAAKEILNAALMIVIRDELSLVGRAFHIPNGEGGKRSYK